MRHSVHLFLDRFQLMIFLQQFFVDLFQQFSGCLAQKFSLACNVVLMKSVEVEPRSLPLEALSPLEMHQKDTGYSSAES
jgi:hypothetical protein